MKFILIVFAVMLFSTLTAQQKINFTRIFQLSLAPAISTNGMHPAGYTNYFSLNLTSGYSSANYLFEAGLISNLNEHETRGFQIAGIANLTGANAFSGLQLKEIDKLKREGFEANLSGAQLSGLANIVLNNVFGWQVSGGVNLSKGALQGVQLAGVSNTVYKYSFGVQLGGIYNVSAESMDGVQVAGLFNITNGGLYGVQAGAFNKAGFIEGKNSYESTDPSAVQFGLINSAGKMNGYQIGLINYAGRMQGTQIGLINIYRNGKMPQTRDGTSIGLINIGSSGYFALYTSDVFILNYEIATGTSKNGRLPSERTSKQIQNALIYSKDPGFLSKRERWALGYGLKKFFFNRTTMPGRAHFRFLSFGVDWMHINHERKKFTKEINILSRPEISVGSRLNPKNRNFFLFVSAVYNIYYSKSGQQINGTTETSGKSIVQHWPGFSAGVLIQ